MLRASSEAVGDDASLDATVGVAVVEVGVEHGDALIAFAEAAVNGEALDELRVQLVEAVGAAGAGQAAATVAAFSGLVRVADGTGIPIDDGLASASVDIRKDLELFAYNGAANSSGVDQVGAGQFVDVDTLWTS